MDLDLEWVLKVLNCFPDVLVEGSRCCLDSGVVNLGGDTCNFSSSKGLQGRPYGGLSKLAEVIPFSNLYPLPHLLADRDEPSCPKE